VLNLSLWDENLIKDSLIGETKIDLTTRFFSKKWKEWNLKPIERRSLWNPASSNPQGLIKMWVEVMTPQEAARNPPVDIAPPQPEPYELRAIVWDMKEVVFKDSSILTGKCSDVFVSIQPEGLKPLKTDVHWRSTGTASFNWRMVWPILLPTKVQHRLRVQVWDKNVASPNEAIAEAVLNLRGFYKKAQREKKDSNIKYHCVGPERAEDKGEDFYVSLTDPNAQGPQGKIKLTVQLLTQDESGVRRAAIGNYTNDPNNWPVLPKPDRPETSFPWYRFDKFMCQCFKKFKGKFICGCIICWLVIIIIIVAIILGKIFL